MRLSPGSPVVSEIWDFSHRWCHVPPILLRLLLADTIFPAKRNAYDKFNYRKRDLEWLVIVILVDIALVVWAIYTLNLLGGEPLPLFKNLQHTKTIKLQYYNLVWNLVITLYRFSRTDSLPEFNLFRDPDQFYIS